MCKKRKRSLNQRNLAPSSSLPILRRTLVSNFYQFLCVINYSEVTPETRKHFFKGDHKSPFFSFFGKFLWWRKTFQLAKLLFSSWNQLWKQGVPFDQMKVSESREKLKKIWKEVLSTINKKTHQFQMFKSNKEVTLRTRGNYFLYRKRQKRDNVKNVFEKSFRTISFSR